MKVLALARIVKPLSPEQRAEVMSREVPATLKLYLDGTIEQPWARTDQPGVCFLMEVPSLDAARAAVDALPLTAGGFAEYDLIPVGPLAPLRYLLPAE